MNEIRFALRQLRKSPAFTFIAILTLALGIGANTAIFSVVNAVLLRPLPYKTPDQLVMIWEASKKDDIDKEPLSFPNFNDYRQQAQSFDGVGGFTNTAPILSAGDGEPERLTGAAVIGDFFSVLGIEPVMGRKFLPEENEDGKNRVVILSHAFWQRRFGADPKLVGQQITLNGNQYTVIGVMAPAFQDPVATAKRPAELWVPLAITEGMRNSRRGDFLQVVARLKPNVSADQARAELQGIAKRLEQQYPDTNTGWLSFLVPLHEELTGNIRPALLILLGAVAFLLLIACANVANLLLARASARQREIAVRSALGASRARIIRQLLTENLILSLAGGAAGLLLAFWGTQALLAISPGNIPRLQSIGIDPQVLLFTIGISLTTGVLFGLAPAVIVSKLNLNDTLKEGGRSSAEGAGGRRVRNGLAIAEIALSLILLVGAGLLIRSFLRLQEVKPGFNPDNILTAQLSLPVAKYAENQQVVNFYDQLLERLAQQPGVKSVSLTNGLPMGGGGDFLAFFVEGKPIARTDRVPDAESRTIGSDYFRTMEIALRRGRFLSEQETQDAPRAAVINEALAKKYFAGEDPIGKRITFGDPQAADATWWNIVGIIADVRQSSLDKDAYPQIFRVYKQNPSRGMTVVMRTAGEPTSMANTLRQEVWSLDRQQPLHNVRTLEQVLADSIARPRFNTLLITILAGVALVLAAVGIYGVISYSVTQRTHEIGVRMALGASSGNVLRLVVGHGMFLAGIGLAVGVVGAFAVTRIMGSLLYGVSASDPLTYIVLVALLGFIALVASYIPARRAMRVDPVVALRNE
jgi:putative ABC transport system permease protein